jgi:hypothetical protein
MPNRPGLIIEERKRTRLARTGSFMAAMIKSVFRAYVDGFATYGAAHHCHVLDLHIHTPPPFEPDRTIDAPDRRLHNDRGNLDDHPAVAENHSGWLDTRHQKARQ